METAHGCPERASAQEKSQLSEVAAALSAYAVSGGAARREDAAASEVSRAGENPEMEAVIGITLGHSWPTNQ